MRILVTGISGFAGRHLTALLQSQGHEVHGTLLPGLDEVPPEGTTPHMADITDAAAVAAALDASGAERVFHLAGAASVGGSFANPLGTWKVNLWGTLAVLEALRQAGRPVRAVMVGSAEAYGRVPLEDLPVDEHTPLRPLSPYGASKAAADIATGQYRDSEGLHVLRVRPFNHIGPGQDDRFVLPTIARQIAEAEARGDERAVLHLGNLATRRDFTDVRDVVRAYALIAERGDPDAAYVIGSGRSLAIRDLVDGLVAHARLPVEVVSDAGRVRPGEQADLYASAARLAADTGWAPEIPLAVSLRETLDWWRRRVAEED